MNHNIYDSDTRFIVDPFTKALSNISAQKSRLIQNDHNSEIITFELPRYIEGHDMSLCNVSQVHYINAGAKPDEQSASIYEMLDLRVDPQDEDKVLCSWLISHNATKYAGSLTFALRFACVEEDGSVQYAWHTAAYTGLAIAEGVFIDGEPILDENIDVLNQYIAIIEGLIADAGKYVLSDEDKAEIVAAVIKELSNGGDDSGESGDSSDDNGGSSGGEKQFTVGGFAYASPNGNNVFNFDEGMTWVQWKQSDYNQFTLGGSFEPDNVRRFGTNENYCNTNIDVSYWDNDLEGICNEDGTPVKDNEVIQAKTYLFNSYLNEYEEDSGGDSGGDTPTEKTFILANNTGYDDYDGHEFLTQRFMSGMTWGEWKESEYTNENWFIWNGCDVTVSYESPNWAIFNANGTPVKDNEVIKEGSGNYYLADADEYEGEGGRGDITFQILFPEGYGTKTYFADEGMTWEEWVNSDFNTDSFYIADNGEYIMFDDGGYTFNDHDYYCVYDGAQICKGDTIYVAYEYDHDPYYG